MFTQHHIQAPSAVTNASIISYPKILANVLECANNTQKYLKSLSKAFFTDSQTTATYTNASKNVQPVPVNKTVLQESPCDRKQKNIKQNNSRSIYSSFSSSAMSIFDGSRFPSLFSSPDALSSTCGVYLQRRSFFSFGRDFASGLSKGALRLQEEANNVPSDPRRQADLYAALLEENPTILIDRFESGKYAKDKHCIMMYLYALYETRKLDRLLPLFVDKSAASNGSAVNSAQSIIGNGTLGSKESPIYVNNIQNSGNAWKRIMNFVNFLVVGAILYSIIMMNEQKIGGISFKVHKYFKKEHAQPEYTFDDVHGCDEAKHELEEIIAFLKNPEKFNKLGAKMPKGVLLVGPPGTGKTLLAKAVAGEADVPFIYASGSEFDEMFVGVGSMRIRQMFESAKEQAPSIIFIDEIDAVGSKRNTRDPQHSRMSLNQLLIEMDGFSKSDGVIVIAATNFPDALDKALLRPGRFDRHVYVPLPDVRGRKQILEHYLKNVPTSPNVKLDVLARSTPGFSGADLCKLVNQAKIQASLKNKSAVSMDLLEGAKDEMLLGTERKSAFISETDRKLTAFHEGGHAIVALFTNDANPIHKATIIPRGEALGMVSQLPEKDELSLSRKQLLARMDVAMGGRAAEELIFGIDSVTTGASSDFDHANAIARAMVTKYGMSSKVGPILVKDDEYESLSTDTKKLIESEIVELLTSSHQRAKDILISHKRDLDTLAKALLEYETVDKEEIGLILAGKKLARKI